MAFDPVTHLEPIRVKGETVQYLKVQWRVFWMKEVNPDWAVRTIVEHADDRYAVVRAEIIDENERIVATGHGCQFREEFKAYVEKAETRAVGRALALAGFGTQYAIEIMETDNPEDLADTPLGRRIAPPPDINKQVGEDFDMRNLKTLIKRVMSHEGDERAALKKALSDSVKREISARLVDGVLSPDKAAFCKTIIADAAMPTDMRVDLVKFVQNAQKEN